MGWNFTPDPNAREIIPLPRNSYLLVEERNAVYDRDVCGVNSVVSRPVEGARDTQCKFSSWCSLADCDEFRFKTIEPPFLPSVLGSTSSVNSCEKGLTEAVIVCWGSPK